MEERERCYSLILSRTPHETWLLLNWYFYINTSRLYIPEGIEGGKKFHVYIFSVPSSDTHGTNLNTRGDIIQSNLKANGQKQSIKYAYSIQIGPIYILFQLTKQYSIRKPFTCVD
jgi:hypothetical protein